MQPNDGTRDHKMIETPRPQISRRAILQRGAILGLRPSALSTLIVASPEDGREREMMDRMYREMPDLMMSTGSMGHSTGESGSITLHINRWATVNVWRNTA
jgi:hypothetical protein